MRSVEHHWNNMTCMPCAGIAKKQKFSWKPLLDVQWDVEPWGSWRVWARNEEYEGLVEATCESPGTPLRAPTADRGLDVYCRDSFFGKVCHRTISPPDESQQFCAAWHLLMHAEFLLDPVLDERTGSISTNFTVAHQACHNCQPSASAIV